MPFYAAISIARPFGNLAKSHITTAVIGWRVARHLLRARTAASRWSTMIHSRRFTPEKGEQSIHQGAKKVCWLLKPVKPSILFIAFPLQRLTVNESRGLAPFLLDCHVLLTIRNLTHCT